MQQVLFSSPPHTHQQLWNWDNFSCSRLFPLLQRPSVMYALKVYSLICSSFLIPVLSQSILQQSSHNGHIQEVEPQPVFDLNLLWYSAISESSRSIPPIFLLYSFTTAGQETLVIIFLFAILPVNLDDWVCSNVITRKSN